MTALQDKATAAETVATLMRFRPTTPADSIQLKDMTSPMHETGGTVNGIHPLLSHQKLQAACEADGEWRNLASEFNPDKQYARGSLVVHGGVEYYMDKTGSTAEPEPTEANGWVETNRYTEWLRVRRQDAAAQTIGGWLKSKAGKGPSIGSARRYNATRDTSQKPSYVRGVMSAGMYIAMPLSGPYFSITSVRIAGGGVPGVSQVQVHLQDVSDRSLDRSQTIDLPADGFAICVANVSWKLEPGKLYVLAVDDPAGKELHRFYPGQPNADILRLGAFSSSSLVTDPLRIRNTEMVALTGTPVSFQGIAQCPTLAVVEPAAGELAEAAALRLAINLLKEVAFTDRVNRKTGSLDDRLVIHEAEGEKDSPRLRKEYNEVLEGIAIATQNLPQLCQPKAHRRTVTYTHLGL